MISVIICSIDPAKFEAITAEYRRALEGEDYEIVGVHDAKSLCEGYNRGLGKSKGDICVFSHDDIELWTPARQFGPRLKRHLAEYDGVGIAGANKLCAPGWFSAGPFHAFGQVAYRVASGYVIAVYGANRARMNGGIRVMDGLFLAFRREVIQKVGWDEKTFDGFQLYDVDVTYRAFRAGYRLAVALDLPTFHQSAGNFDSPEWQKYARIFYDRYHQEFEPNPFLHFEHASALVRTREEAMMYMNKVADSFPETV